MKEGEFKNALGFLREAYVHHPEEARIKVKMAVCHLKMGEKELSLNFLKEALQDNADLESEFAYYFPEGSREKEFEAIIKQYKK
jgi:tetratricopeptide (TPR) repeat protein